MNFTKFPCWMARVAVAVVSRAIDVALHHAAGCRRLAMVPESDRRNRTAATKHDAIPNGCGAIRMPFVRIGDARPGKDVASRAKKNGPA
ncbi:hypothetical protein LGN43_30040 [Burkholderia multivorans]|nr:hypothetical protein [Burkholderia multivorans]